MRRFLLFVLTAFASFALANEAQAEEFAMFEKSVYDFGEVPRVRRDYHCHFTLKNTSSEPLVVLGVDTSCSCLKARYSRRPIPVGASIDIKVILEAAKMNDGVFHRVVKVRTNKGVMLLTVKGVSVGSKRSK